MRLKKRSPAVGSLTPVKQDDFFAETAAPGSWGGTTTELRKDLLGQLRDDPVTGVDDSLAGKDNEAIRGVANKVIELAHSVKHSASPTRREAGIAADSVVMLANILRRVDQDFLSSRHGCVASPGSRITGPRPQGGRGIASLDPSFFHRQCSRIGHEPIELSLVRSTWNRLCSNGMMRLSGWPMRSATSSTRPFRQLSSGSAQRHRPNQPLSVPRCKRKIQISARGGARAICATSCRSRKSGSS